VEVTITRRATTLVSQHVGFLEGLTLARTKAIGRPSLLN
jgi:hypothetical protein